MDMGDVTIGAVISSGIDPWVIACLSTGIAAGAVVAFRDLRGTTLAAPAAWAVASALAMAVVEVSILLRPVGALGESIWHYAAAAGTFCPLMAVLGAKRPQDRGWQWIVVSLWVILLVPALQAVAARSGARLELFGAWQLLLAGLIAMGLLNYLPTRFTLAAFLMAMGQTMILGPYLFDASAENSWRFSGTVAILGAVGAAIGITKQSPRIGNGDRQASELQEFNQRWAKFRDGWGAFWGLRVMQRVNQTAELSGWPLRLEWWNGFVPIGVASDGPDSDAIDVQMPQIQQTLDSLLRRFERLDDLEAIPGGRSPC
jgi:hypothetical protein